MTSIRCEQIHMTPEMRKTLQCGEPSADNRLTEIACSLQRGDALAGAMSALDGWEARNIGAARMRGHLADAMAQLAELAAELGSEARWIEFERLAQQEIAEAQERRPSLWQRIFGVRHE